MMIGESSFEYQIILQVSGQSSERRGRPKRPSSASSMLGCLSSRVGGLSSRVTSIGGLSSRVTPTNSDPVNRSYNKPQQAFLTPSPRSENPPFGDISIPNHTMGSSEVKSSPNNVTKTDDQGTEVKVSPKASPCAFKSGPEVPRTIYPGLDDFLPECDGKLVEN